MACVVVIYAIQSYYNWIQKYTQQTDYKKTSKIGLISRSIVPLYSRLILVEEAKLQFKGHRVNILIETLL